MPDFQNAYKRRYEEPVIRQIEGARRQALGVGGSMLVGFSQGGELSLADEHGRAEGICYSLVTRWFRAKLNEEDEETFYAWLLSRLPSMSTSDARLKMLMRRRDDQMQRWQEKQSFATKVHGALVEDLKAHGMDNVDDPERLVAEYLQSLEDPKDDQRKYNLRFNTRHPVDTDGVPQQTFYTLTASTTHLSHGWPDKVYPVHHDMQRQLAIRKILKHSTSSQRFNEPKRSKNFIFRLDGTEAAFDTFAREVRKVVETCSNPALGGTTELFIYVTLWGKEPHAIGAYHLAYPTLSFQDGRAEVFDANHGVFKFSYGSPKERCKAMAGFLGKLMKQSYTDSTLLSLWVLAVQ